VHILTPHVFVLSAFADSDHDENIVVIYLANIYIFLLIIMFRVRRYERTSSSDM
jgi:hypothetical protein